MAVLVLLHEPETGTLKQKDISKIQANEIKFVRSVKECSKLNKMKNEEIRKDMTVYSIRIKKTGKVYVLRMNAGRLHITQKENRI